MDPEPDNLATLVRQLVPALWPPFLSTGITGHHLPDTLPGTWESKLQHWQHMFYPPQYLPNMFPDFLFLLKECRHEQVHGMCLGAYGKGYG